MLNKPISLSLLLFLAYFIISFFMPQANNLLIFCLESVTLSFVIALLFGLFQKKLKISLEKTKKVKIAVYYSMILMVFIPLAAFLSYFFNNNSIMAISLTALIFFCLNLILGGFLYLGLLLGDKLASSK